MLLKRGERNELEDPFVGGRQDDVGSRSVLVSRSQFAAVTAPAGAGH
jgi:hypothetical protein